MGITQFSRPHGQGTRSSAGLVPKEAEAHLGTLLSSRARWSSRPRKPLQMESQLVLPLILSWPLPLPASSRQTHLNARQALGSRFPLQVRKGRLGHTCASQPAPLADLVWGGLPASPQKSTLRRP